MMGYNADVRSSAKSIMQQRRNNALRESDIRKQDFFDAYPQAQKIEQKLSSTTILAAKAVAAGANAKEQLQLLKDKNLHLQDELGNIYKSAGITEKDLEPQFVCEKCNDTGYIDGKICSCYKALLRQVAYDKLNAVSPLSLCSFDTFDLSLYSSQPIDGSGRVAPYKRMENIYNYCKEYAENFSKNSESLLLRGSTGLGKTHLSLAIARTVIDKGYGVVYCSTPNIVSKLEKEHFRKNKYDEELNTEEMLCECDLLILDDLGTEFITTFSTSSIYNIVNTRIMTEKPTIINTNMTLSELEKTYSQRFVSRIIGESTKLDFIGNDIRQKRKTGK